MLTRPSIAIMLCFRSIMRLTRVELDNFRGFGETRFDLLASTGKPYPVVVLVGPSGSGKTAVLQAISGFFGGLAGNIQGIRPWPVPKTIDDLYMAIALTSPDIRQGAAWSRLRMVWTDAWELSSPAPQSFDSGVYLLSSGWATNPSIPIQALMDEEKVFGSTDPALYASPDPAAVIAWHVGAFVNPGAMGLIVAFDELRLLPRGQIPGPNLNNVTRHRCWMALAPSDLVPQGQGLRFQQLKQWLVNLDYARLKIKDNRSAIVWDRLRYMLNKLLSPCEFIEVDEGNEVLFRTPTGTIRLESLGAGFRSLFVIAVDLLLRLSLATSDGDPLAREAICLIDEVDAHLDPELQERVIPDLQAIFPGVQFIVSTHSPLVAGAVSRDQIFVLGES